MAQRVYVKVVGFEDVERHTLNTLFRVSEGSDVSFALWLPDGGNQPDIAFIDSQSHEARVEFEAPANAGLKVVWVGPGAPARAWQSFQRPLQWGEIIAALSSLLRPAEPVDFDLDAMPPQQGTARRALIASADRDERLYLRARLALGGLTHADEVETGTQAMEFIRGSRYEVAFLDFDLPGVTGWDLVLQVAGMQPRIPLVVVTKDTVSDRERARAEASGVAAMLSKPPHPTRIKALIAKV